MEINFESVTKALNKINKEKYGVEPFKKKEQLFTAYFNRDKDKFFLLFTDDKGSEATYYLNDEYDLGEKITELIQEYEREN